MNHSNETSLEMKDLRVYHGLTKDGFGTRYRFKVRADEHSVYGGEVDLSKMYMQPEITGSSFDVMRYEIDKLIRETINAIVEDIMEEVEYDLEEV